MKNLLITGGAGFIGSNFVRYLLRANPAVKITNLDSLTYAGNAENLADIQGVASYQFVHGNICDSELVRSLLKKHEIDTIVHFAAETHVDRSIHSPTTFVETNVLGTLALLQAARESWGDKNGVRFHHVSTDEVYGSLEEGAPAFVETSPYSPNSPYAASKAGSDHLVRAFFTTYGLPITISNCSNNYGPYQYPEKLIPLAIANGLAGKAIPVYGDGRQIRDWLHVIDHARAVETILEKGQIGETYNLGGDAELRNLEMVELICQALDEVRPDEQPHNRLIKFVTDRPGHDRRYAMNFQKIRNELGWAPAYSIQAGLRETVNWYIANGDWVSNVQAKKDYQAWIGIHYTEKE